MEQSTISLSANVKRILSAVAIVSLTAVMYLSTSGVLSMLALILQIGLFSALISSKPKYLQALLPLASYGIGYMFTNSFVYSITALMYVPAAAAIGISLRKRLSRAATVVISSVAVGVTAIAVVVAEVLAAGIRLSVSDISLFVSQLIESVSDYLVAGVPDSLFDTGYTKEMYIAYIKAGIKQFFFSFAVVLCNIIAFSATAVTRRAVKWLETESSDVAALCKNWLFVLSKPSAIMFIVCYLCLLIGGKTLTLSQVIAFNTVMAATLCGLMVMACRTIREKFRIAGFSSILIYVVLFYFFQLQGVTLVLSITGIIAVFRRKSKEDVK